ncbi:hypothetical protein [Micromonospora coerulea]|uniref:hypothetical protein n=1 Tax=Micromonospora coerulea TaxID=47856 RepID=UPI00190623BA
MSRYSTTLASTQPAVAPVAYSSNFLMTDPSRVAATAPSSRAASMTENPFATMAAAVIGAGR